MRAYEVERWRQLVQMLVTRMIERQNAVALFEGNLVEFAVYPNTL